MPAKKAREKANELGPHSALKKRTADHLAPNAHQTYTEGLQRTLKKTGGDKEQNGSNRPEGLPINSKAMTTVPGHPDSKKTGGTKKTKHQTKKKKQKPKKKKKQKKHNVKRMGERVKRFEKEVAQRSSKGLKKIVTFTQTKLESSETRRTTKNRRQPSKVNQRIEKQGKVKVNEKISRSWVQ